MHSHPAKEIRSSMQKFIINVSQFKAEIPSSMQKFSIQARSQIEVIHAKIHLLYQIGSIYIVQKFQYTLQIKESSCHRNRTGLQQETATKTTTALENHTTIRQNVQGHQHVHDSSRVQRLLEKKKGGGRVIFQIFNLKGVVTNIISFLIEERIPIAVTRVAFSLACVSV